MPRKQRASLATGGSDFKDYLGKLTRAQADRLEKLIEANTGIPSVEIDVSKGTMHVVRRDEKYGINVRSQLKGAELKNVLEGARDSVQKGKEASPVPAAAPVPAPKKGKARARELKGNVLPIAQSGESKGPTGFAAVRAAKAKKDAERAKSRKDGGKKAKQARNSRVFNPLSEPFASGRETVPTISKEQAAAALAKNKGKERYARLGSKLEGPPPKPVLPKAQPKKGEKAFANPKLKPGVRPAFTPGPVRDSTTSLNPREYGTNAPVSSKPTKKFREMVRAGDGTPVIGSKAQPAKPTKIKAALKGGGATGGVITGLREARGDYRWARGLEEEAFAAMKKQEEQRKVIEAWAKGEARKTAERERRNELRRLSAKAVEKTGVVTAPTGKVEPLNTREYVAAQAKQGNKVGLTTDEALDALGKERTGAFGLKKAETVVATAKMAGTTPVAGRLGISDFEKMAEILSPQVLEEAAAPVSRRLNVGDFEEVAAMLEGRPVRRGGIAAPVPVGYGMLPPKKPIPVRSARLSVNDLEEMAAFLGGGGGGGGTSVGGGIAGGGGGGAIQRYVHPETGWTSDTVGRRAAASAAEDVVDATWREVGKGGGGNALARTVKVGAGAAGATGAAVKAAEEAGGWAALKAAAKATGKWGGRALAAANPVLGPVFTAWMLYDLAKLGYDVYTGNEQEEELKRKAAGLENMRATAESSLENQGRINPAMLDRMVNQSKLANMASGLGRRRIDDELSQLVEGQRERLASISMMSKPSLAEAYANMGVL